MRLVVLLQDRITVASRSEVSRQGFCISFASGLFLVWQSRRRFPPAETFAREATHEQVIAWFEKSALAEKYAQEAYEFGLANGIPKEVARKDLPVGQYSRMRASANLRNWLAFMTLRADPDAQWEIQEFAHVVGNILAARFPRTWELFDAARKKAA